MKFVSELELLTTTLLPVLLGVALFFIIRFIDLLDHYDYFTYISKPQKCKKCHKYISVFANCTHATHSLLTPILSFFFVILLFYGTIFVIEPYLSSIPLNPEIEEPEKEPITWITIIKKLGIN